MMHNLTPAELVDMGICPTCYDRQHGHCLYGDPAGRMLYENELFECLLIGNPRAPGHSIISTKAHYKDMMDLPDELCREIYSFARRVMVALKQVYTAESVYLCTMCDGPMNHFHVQLIPRYLHERRGSGNFVKERSCYVEDREKLFKIRKLLNSDL
ncbi:MAG: HIT family protein [Oscillospiraceae bacterium]|nr:HIT family protein [Oscillospiraceae bacterium]